MSESGGSSEGRATTRIDPDLLLAAYAQGLFPMADDADDPDVFWVEPRDRAILPLGGFHLSRRLARTVAADRFRVTTDTAFPAIIDLCAESAPDRPSTWINGAIRSACFDLFARGHAHSVEVWDGDRLAGGLYGIALGGAFFGESMVSRARDASKVALAWLVARLRVGGFELLDCQFMTDHLASLGAIEMPQADYLKRLHPAVSASPSSVAGSGDGAGSGFGAALGAARGDWRALEAVLAADDSGSGASPPGKRIVQLLTNTS